MYLVNISYFEWEIIIIKNNKKYIYILIQFSLGGGKDLATATGIANIKDEKPADAPSNVMAKGQGALNSKNHFNK